MTAATHKILQAGPVPPALAALLPQVCETHVLGNEADPAAFLLAHGGEFTMVVTNATAGASADLMSRLPRLQAICSIGAGTETIDLGTAQARGIVVSNTPDVLNDCVADLAIGLMIDVARGISAADRYVRRGDWPAKGSIGLRTRVSGKRLGLLGMGGIARVIARRASGFSMDIRYHSRTPKPGLPWPHEPSLAQLAQWADFLVVACSGGPPTRHLVSAEVLRALGPQGFLVNVARGSVVDEAALVQALQAGELAGAALDVFEDEPRVPAPLAAMENVVLASHIGSSTQETRRAMVDLTLANVRSFVETGRLVTEAKL
ncbi:MAG TPA: 2-hydroxyacid dehydrogenase [Ramlibacter sp.]|nr:2-hydroxyacid dehydrogenase [Ramlibacter sp.]